VGRLPSLILFVTLTLTLTLTLGCDRSTASPQGASRSEAVAAKETTPAASAGPGGAAGSASAHAPQAPPRKLCEKELLEPGRKLPKTTFTPVATAGAPLPGDHIATGGGRWTWINFFAAWCGPCKEEMPRLRGFQAKLASELAVVFVSLDDDERQLERFLTGPPGGSPPVPSALWLEPGKRRSTWLSALNMKDPPDLPAHVLVDPTGKVRCVLGGAVDDSDFAAVASIVRR
jgi:thiol-disulfide isomerase/thioredoxin